MSELTGELGEEKYLSQEERMQVRRLLKFTEEYPDELGTYIKEFLKVNPPQVTAHQVRGSRGAPRYINIDTELVQVGSVTASTVVHTTKIPGRTIAKNGEIEVFLLYKAMCTDASNTLTIWFKLGGSTIESITRTTGSHLDGNNRIGAATLKVSNLGAYNQQIAFGSDIFDSESAGTVHAGLISTIVLAVDTSQDKDLTIEFDWVSAGTQNAQKLYVATKVFNPIGAD